MASTASSWMRRSAPISFTSAVRCRRSPPVRLSRRVAIWRSTTVRGSGAEGMDAAPVQTPSIRRGWAWRQSRNIRNHHDMRARLPAPGRHRHGLLTPTVETRTCPEQPSDHHDHGHYPRHHPLAPAPVPHRPPPPPGRHPLPSCTSPASSPASAWWPPPRPRGRIRRRLTHTLMALPPPFDGFVEHTKRVSPTCLVHLERNRYSVPPPRPSPSPTGRSACGSIRNGSSWRRRG